MKSKRKTELSTNNWIVKSNALNEIRNNRMTISQIRLFSIYLSKINPKDEKTREVTFKVDEYARIMQFKQTNITRFQKSAEDLLSLIVTFYDKTQVHPELGYAFVKCQIFKKIKFFKDKDTEEWYITIDCHDDVLRLMFDLRGYYFKYQLWNALQLTSPNQQRMYEILKQYEYAGVREISVKDLREFLGLEPNEYLRWDNFKKRILDSSQQVLENYTDIKYTWEITGKRGKGGKIQSLKFNIEKNNDYFHQLTLDEYLTEQAAPAMEGELTEFEYENENLSFLAEACEKEFDENQMTELLHLLNKAVPYSVSKNNKLERYDYLAEKYTYSKNRSNAKGKLFNYLKTVIEADIKQLQ